MKIESTTESYNERRFSKPWIAGVTFDEAADAQFEFGTWVGRAGDAGILVIDAEPGAIVARGQRDYRGNRTTVDYYQVEADGTLTKLDGKPAAYRAFQAAQAAAEKAAAEPADEREALLAEREALLAEREALLARLAEIDAALGDAVPAAPAPAPRKSNKTKATGAAALILLGQLPLFPALFGF